MKLTDSISATVGTGSGLTLGVTAIASATAAARQFMCYFGTTISSAITGAIGLEKNGAGTLTLSGVCNYTGETKINDGSLAISSASTLNGVISGDGVLEKSGAGNLTLGNTNTYFGGTLSSGGTITFTQNNPFGTGLFTAQTASQIITSTSVTLPNNFQINSGATMQYRTGIASTTLTISGNIAGGNGFLSKTSNGRLHLDGVLTYTGSTNIVGGFLRAKNTVGASTATATFQSDGLSLVVSFNVAPPSGVTSFRFFQGTTVQTYATVTLTGLPAGSTAIYTSATSTLSVTVP